MVYAIEMFFWENVMVELFLSRLERVAKVQPQLTILILLLVLFGSDLVSFVSELKGVLQ